MDYEIVIGLEVHVQLKTKTKAFCGCSTVFGSQPNMQTCPVCLGFPGSLPVLNEAALELAYKAGIALDCQIQPFTKFDRKNYYYPDLPKNYQISQYDLPLALNGYLDIEYDGINKRVKIKRVHLEEDAGKLIHEEDCSLVDYNRAGIPLLEIVTEPDINSPREAYEYLASLKSILKYLGVSDCDMEKGFLRCDANISLRKAGETALGTKAELKNMNSFKGVKDALAYEINRQKELLEEGKKIIQETRLWNTASQKTFTMRSKEEAMDYRYFPEPDLPPFTISEEKIRQLKSALPELPKQVSSRFIKDYSLNTTDAGILTAEKALAEYFESCVKIYPKPKTIGNWLIGALTAELNSRAIEARNIPIKTHDLISLIKFAEEGKISNLIAKDVLKTMFDTGKAPDEIINEKDLAQVSDANQLEEAINKVITENAKSTADYKAGKTNAMMFLVGQVMRQTKGKANPNVVQEILKEKLKT